MCWLSFAGCTLQRTDWRGEDADSGGLSADFRAYRALQMFTLAGARSITAGALRRQRQMNVDTICRRHSFSQRWVNSMLRKGYIDVAATDAHNVTSRPCRMRDGYQALQKGSVRKWPTGSALNFRVKFNISNSPCRAKTAGAADCRQKAILAPKGENSPFRK